jgi:hypothetical protein
VLIESAFVLNLAACFAYRGVPAILPAILRQGTTVFQQLRPVLYPNISTKLEIDCMGSGILKNIQALGLVLQET